MTLKELDIRLTTLTVTKNIKNDEGFLSLCKMLSAQSDLERAQYFCNYAYSLAAFDFSTADFVAYLLLKESNPYAEKLCRGEKSEHLAKAVKSELDFLARLCTLPLSFFEPLFTDAAIFKSLPVIKNDKALNIAEILKGWENGCGVFALNKAFVWSKHGTLEPVSCVNPITLADLKGYEEEKQQVVENTLFFLSNKPAVNVLLYGDRGTGKSSTVHALLNEYADKGLRVIEVPKSRLTDLPKILELIKNMKNKFIIFLDDLSFSDGTDDYSELKAVLEGSISKAKNVLVYATTNRRHLIKETHAERGDDVHSGDTVQEKLSLSDRFGLIVTYINPTKQEFLDIIKGILADRGIYMDETALQLRAEQYALKKGGRSPRGAKQLADMIECGV